MDGSLGRYLGEHGMSLLYGGGREQGRVLGIIGSIMLPVGVGVMIAGAATASEFGYGGIGPALAGIVQLGMGRWMRRKGEETKVVLEPDAAALVRAVMAESRRWRSLKARPVDGFAREFLMAESPHKSGRVDGAARELLEACAGHAMRIDGALAAAGPSRPALARRSRALMEAVHVGMAEAFRHAAVALARPEAAATALGMLRETEGKLGELADRIESMARVATLEDRIAAATPLDDALDGLRAEATAERELA